MIFMTLLDSPRLFMINILQLYHIIADVTTLTPNLKVIAIVILEKAAVI